MSANFESVKYFKPAEFFGDHEKMDAMLIYSLDELRKFAGRPIVINSAYRSGDPGTHGQGVAVDIAILGLPLLGQFLLAERTRLFSGIGLYPYWNRPGLHLDTRQLKRGQHGARWGRNAAGVYVALDAKFLVECANK